VTESVSGVYVSSPIKRERRTKAEMQLFREHLLSRHLEGYQVAQQSGANQEGWRTRCSAASMLGAEAGAKSRAAMVMPRGSAGE
jgi:hypothetical protein